MFKPVLANVQLSKLEEEITKYWKENKIFEKSIELRSADKKWTFLDGPPFVTGTPHYGSLLSSLPKDVFGRFYTMKGYQVRRVWGWDGHGLPIENKVEGALDIKSKKDIENVVGVKRFIDECKKYVNDVSAEWEWYVDKIGRWVDFKNAYRTWDRDYMESVMWVFKQMYDKGFIYRGLKNSLYCPHCATPISNFEVAMDQDKYKEVQDFATTYKYQLEEGETAYILAWSTTPWNKIVTPALAVNPDLEYVKVKQGNEIYILAKTTTKILGEESSYQILEEFKGVNLIGKKFVPHYDYYKENVKKNEKVFEIIEGNFVTADEGTGVVTIAAFGEEDLREMIAQNIHIEIHLDEEGNVKNDVPKFGGMYFLKANKAVNEDLANRGLIYHDEQVAHKVPLCWRCHTRLYNAAINAWYVNVQDLKPLMKKTNEDINWFPKHFKKGRFLKSLENAPDWNISRNRYWGSPVPVWECSCGECFVPGSIAELEKESGTTVKDLHKPEIDEVTIKCRKCGDKVFRTSEVLDSWIEAGSASFAERHFPFKSDEKLEDFFPPDYVAEYTGQIRAWFYVMHVIGAALYESKAFKNVSVEGVILGTDGRKMSKNYGNYPDPRDLLDKYGGDALRLYLLGSPVMHGEDIIISEEAYRNQVRGTLLILWNIYNFFVSYANIDGWGVNLSSKESINALDKWILSLLNGLNRDVVQALESYDTVVAISKIQDFVNEFSTWYIRRSRNRVGPSVEDAHDKNAFYSTTYEVLTTLSKLMAPITPFITEEIYRNLTGGESVHLTDWPEPDMHQIDKKLDSDMVCAKDIASLIHEKRKLNNLKVKIPLKKLNYSGRHGLNKEIEEIIKDEANVYELVFEKNDKDWEVTGSFDVQNQDVEAGISRDLIRKIQAERKNLGTRLDELVDVKLREWPEKFEKEIKKGALVDNLIQADEFLVVRKNA